jgi:hypothetical protein
MQYDVQYYNRHTALWTTVSTFDALAPAIAEFDRQVDEEHDPEIRYRVIQTETVNTIVRQS